MEIKQATIKREDKQTILVLDINDNPQHIVLTEDNPNNIKSAFNVLLKELKNGEFNFNLNDDKEDLYHHISVEYITQLNRELSIIYKDLSNYDLLVKSED